MKRFTFPLERVRRWRSEQADLEEVKLQQLCAQQQRLRNECSALAAEIVRSEQQVLGQRSLEPIELASLDAYRMSMRNRIRITEEQIRQCEARIVEQRGRVTEARRKLELLERLHEKAREEWLAASDREQELLAAELFLAKAVRNRE